MRLAFRKDNDTARENNTENGTGRSHNCMGAGQGGRAGGRDRLYRTRCAFQGSVDGLCRCFLVSEALRHIFSSLLIVLGELSAG